MKKRVWMLLALILCLTGLLLGGCAGSAESGAAEPETQESLPASGGVDQAAEETEFVDVDLTRMSANMVYAEVSNMMMRPSEYLGKRIKLSGPYYASHYPPTDQYYHFVLVEDALACCKQGIEFIWTGEHPYPDDYPADYTAVELTGIYESYMEGDYTYYHLVVDGITVI